MHYRMHRSFVLICFELLCFVLFCFVLFCFVLFAQRSLADLSPRPSWPTDSEGETLKSSVKHTQYELNQQAEVVCGVWGAV